jgi:hypothetical protein
MRPLLAIIALLLLGMAPWSEDAPDTRIPEPSISFKVEVVDVDLNKFDVVKASVDGHIFLTGAIGRAKVSIPFDKIDRIHFEPRDERGLDLLAVVTLHGGEQQTLELSGTVPCYGQTSYGNLSIETRFIRDAVFRGRAP